MLVTGASGFIGSHLCRRLRQAGAEVHAISRSERTEGETGLHWWQGDVTELDVLRRIVNATRPEVVFHLASHVVGAREREQVMPAFRANLTSAVNVMIAASEAGCRRVVLTGSLEEPEDGDTGPVPCSPYAAAKWAASGYARMFHALYQLDVVTLRVFMVYGPGQGDLKKLIPYVTLALLRGESPKLGNGQREVDWIYVDDVVEGFVAAAQANGRAGQTVDIGSGKLVPIRAVVEHLGRLINPDVKLQFGALPERPLERVRVADTARTQAMIGWQPSVPLEKGLKQTVDWYARRLKENAL
jgi:nucleoside-diphosphate-sugar epimerase